VILVETTYSQVSTYASLALTAGLESTMCRMLGHADIGLTVATYGSWLNPSRPAALDALDRVPVAAAAEAT
jgi:hypothetical protein